MPRKNNSVNMYGKSWGPVDEQNLKNAIKLMEQLNKLAENFAGSLSSVNKITNQINEAARLKNELDKIGVKLNEDQAKNVLKALDAKKQQNTESKKYNDLNDVIDSVNRNYANKTPNRLTSGNFGSTVVGAIQQNRAQTIFKEQLTQGLKNAGQKDIKSGKVLDYAYKETADKMNQSAGKYSKASSLLQIAADTFMSAVKTFGGMFTEGKNKQVNTYEDTFTGIAARTGYSRSEYYTQQAQTNNELGDLGLRDNIRTSEVQQMWSTLTSEGLSMEDSIANAFDTVISSKVVPYLNTSTAQFQFLVDQQPNLITQVRGIGRTTMEISGSATFATKYLQDMIDTIAPMASLAENELGLQFAQVSGAYESLRAQGLNDAQIGEMYKASASVYNNPYQALKSGSLDEKMAVANVIQTGGDLRDFSDVNTSMMTSQNFVANLVPEGNLGPLYSGMLVSGNKLSGTTALGVALNEGNYDMEQAISDGIKASNMVDDMGNKVTEEFRNGDYQTNKERQAITMENLSNELATMQQFMGGWYDVIVTAIKGVAGMIAATVVGKGIGALAGSVAGGTGSGILASGGGIALGTVGTVAASAALVAAIGAGIYQADQKNKEESAKTAEENFKNSDSSFASSDTASKFVSGAGAELNTDDLTGWGKFMRSAGDAMDTWGLGIRKGWTGVTNFFDGKKGWTDTDYVGKNAQYWNSIVASGLRNFNSDEDRGGYYAAYAFLLDQVNSLESTNKMGESITKGDLKSLFTTVNPDTGESLFKYWSIGSKMSYFINNGLVPTGEDGTKATGNIDYASVYGAPKGSYRSGLNNVPEDNYPALLHQGEAVLTASTANELRTLVDEYRSTNKESISFETIIQNQTSSLISKMDEMLQVMRSFTGTTTDWRNGFITNSMKYVKSTKSFS